jgi:flagellar biogenesis protein FliO
LIRITAQSAVSSIFAPLKSPVLRATSLNLVGALTLIFLQTSWLVRQMKQKAEPVFAERVQAQQLKV